MVADVIEGRKTGTTEEEIIGWLASVLPEKDVAGAVADFLQFKPRSENRLVDEVVKRLKEGMSEEDIAEWLASKMHSAEAIYAAASSLGSLGDDLDFEYGVQCGAVGDLLLPLARERLERKSEEPV